MHKVCYIWFVLCTVPLQALIVGYFNLTLQDILSHYSTIEPFHYIFLPRELAKYDTLLHYNTPHHTVMPIF